MGENILWFAIGFASSTGLLGLAGFFAWLANKLDRGAG